MKVIFLDIDGVIITNRSIRNKDLESKADPAAVAALNRVIEATGAKIVVSSTWRAHGIVKMREYLALWGIQGQLFGLTPELDSMYHGGLYGFAREREIMLWLELCPDPIEAVVVLDDDVIGSPANKWQVHTGFDRGLTEAMADQAIAVLTAKKKAKEKSPKLWLSDLDYDHRGGYRLK